MTANMASVVTAIRLSLDPKQMREVVDFLRNRHPIGDLDIEVPLFANWNHMYTSTEMVSVDETATDDNIYITLQGEEGAEPFFEVYFAPDGSTVHYLPMNDAAVKFCGSESGVSTAA